ncbi:hypothetical protein ASC76_17105 [Rhizobacter sp. Root404]|nr:hypothetical protein ASC76_17105 [Rhizobacter sp. Root404]
MENKTIGITRTPQVDANGAYVVSQLPAGTYTVTAKKADGTTSTRTVEVLPGQGTSADFLELARVVVVGSSSTIDTKSTESATLITKAELDRIPVAHDTTSITLLAPGATLGDGRIGQTSSRGGNVASLGGASPAENAYYINGFNVTNIVNGVAFNSIPYEGIASQQVKTGGYGAEYGRSLGGVISVNTKRGTDEWHGGANVIYTPKSLRGSSVYAAPDGNGGWDLVNRPGGTTNLTSNVWAGGPLIKDTLYGFALVQGASVKTNTYGNTQQTELKNDTPQYLVKLDWNLNKNNLIEFTAFSDKSKDKIHTWNSTGAYETGRASDLGIDTFTAGGETYIGKWTSVITDNFTVSGLYGVGKYDRSSVVPSSDCPIVQDRRTAPTQALGCSTATTISIPNANDKREAWRLDAEWTLGKHTIRGGLDSEKYTTVDGTVYSGGEYFFLRRLNAGSRLANGYVNTTGSAFDYIENRHYSNGGKFLTENSAWYLEDNFQVTPNVLLNIGLRNESFTNKNAEGTPFVKVKNTWAPRLGASWDVSGNSDLKVYSNYGRYYIPVYANTNVRLSGLQTDYREYFQFDGTFTPDQYVIPGKGAQLGGRVTNSDGTAPDPRTVVDPNLKPMYQDEFILGFQKAIQDKWTFGMKYTHRNLKSAMDDICYGDGAAAWAAANGYSASQATNIGASIDHCFLANPGRDLTANVDLDDTGVLTAVTVPASALKFEKPKRTYDALEFTLERAWDKKWSFYMSYVLAFSKGNTEGYVKSDIGQDDAGISQDWDYPGLMEGASGYLPNDRRHTIKAFGSFAATPEWRLGASILVQSGRPKNCFGVYDGATDQVSALYGAASFYCGGVLGSRGDRGRLGWITDVNVQATYTPTWLKGATFSVDVLNVFNRRGVRVINEAGEQAVGSPDPTYGQPVLNSLQAARSVRLLAQYEF